MVGIRGQRKAILEYMREHGSITSMEAFEKFGATRLSAIMFDFKKSGLPIISIMVDGQTRYGDSCKYAKYILGEINE